jgi:uncharacterized protein YqeY
METLQTKISTQIKEAMMAKDQVRLDTLRGVKTAFTNELVAKGRKPTDELTDEESLAVIARLAKQRKDSIEQFAKGGRMDLAEDESAQLSVLEVFLPQMMSREEVMTVAQAKKTELAIEDKAKAGMLMSNVMKELKGKADGTLVKEVVDSLFS